MAMCDGEEACYLGDDEQYSKCGKYIINVGLTVLTQHGIDMIV